MMEPAANWATIELEKIPDTSFPHLLSFPHGVPSNCENMALQILSKGEGKKRKMSVQGTLNGAVFHGSDFGEDSWKKDSCKYAIGVLNETTNSIRLMPADHAFVMKLMLSNELAPENDASMTYIQRRQSLTDAFGSKKKKRALLAAQSNYISSENIESAAAMEDALQSLVPERSSIKIDSAQESLEQNRIQLLPTYNINAEVVEEAYPIQYIVPDQVLEGILEHFEFASIENPATNITLQMILQQIETSDFILQILENNYNKMIQYNLSLYKNKHKAYKAYIGHLIYLTYLIKFYSYISADPHLSAAHSNIIIKLCHPPADAMRHVTDNFSMYKKFKGVATHSCQKSHM